LQQPLRVGVGQEVNLPGWGAGVGWIAVFTSLDRGWDTTLNCQILLGERLTYHSQGSYGVTQLLPGEKRNISDHVREAGGEHA
jgi:hypothetical protein